MNIAIDGPAGAGKSTIAKLVAKEFGSQYVDTGAMFRVIALHVLDEGVDPEDENKVETALKGAAIDISYEGGVQIIRLNGADTAGKIRTEEVGNVASKISAYKAVRDKLLAMQRNVAKEYSVVMDGRDIGTVVLPQAELKIFLTASVEERANRRYKELVEKGESPDIEKIKEDIEKRDLQDSTRKIAPLKKAEDAIEIDSSEMSIEEVVAEIIKYAGEKK